MGSPRRRPFLVWRHGAGPVLRIEAMSPLGCAREAIARLGTDRPVIVHERRTGTVHPFWTAPGSDEPSPARFCEDCGRPIRPAGKRGRPRTAHPECREQDAA